MSRSAPHPATAHRLSGRTHHRIDLIGAAAVVVGAVGLITAVLVLRPYAPTAVHARAGGGVDACS
jgi:hypothetical protein